MIKSPMLWGAGLAVALGGAVAGNALGSTRVLDRSTVASFYQTHPVAEGRMAAAVRPPDHYPLVTRDGTVPVEQLAERGLLSQKRYRAIYYAAAYVPVDDGYEEYRPGEEWRDAATRDALSSAERAPEPAPPEVETASEPLQLAAGPAAVSEGEAKAVEVDAVLAMR